MDWQRGGDPTLLAPQRGSNLIMPPVPLAQDPNTGVAMFESSAIVDYLYKTYGQPATPAAAA